MATFRAYSSFFEFDFDLSRTIYGQESSTFGDNVSQTIAGRTYPDVAAYEIRTNGYHGVYFGGTGLARGTGTVLSAGTVNGIFDFVGKLNTFTTPAYSIQGIALKGTAVGAAQNTIDNQDDLALLAKAFSGNDRFILSEQVDAVSGYAGNDVIYGYGGGDLIYGGDGNDRIYGGAGDDQLEGGRGDDLLYGNAGVDTVSYQNADTGVTVDLRITIAQDTIGAGIDTLSSFDRLYGSAFDDRLTGNTGANEIIGLSGNDIILGKAGNDRLDGGSGRDTLSGGTGADQFSLFGFASSADRDLITDFSHAQGDHILLSKLTFQGLSGDVDTALSAAQFYTAAGATKAHDADDRIVYNPVTGAVYYDADGAGGAASVQILKMGAGVHPVLEAGDFLLSF